MCAKPREANSIEAKIFALKVCFCFALYLLFASNVVLDSKLVSEVIALFY